MSISLSKRQADKERILTILKNTPNILPMLASKSFEEVVEDICEDLGASENEVAEALQTLVREHMSLASHKTAQEEQKESPEEFVARVKNGDTFSPEQYIQYLESKGLQKEQAIQNWKKLEDSQLGNSLFRHDMDSYYFRMGEKKKAQEKEVWILVNRRNNFFIKDKTFNSKEEAEEFKKNSYPKYQTYFPKLKKQAQTNIVIPATSGHPEKTITIPGKPKGDAEKEAIPAKTGDVSVPVNPDSTDEDKTKDLIKSVDTPQKSRQQALIDAVKGLKVALGGVAEAITGIPLSQEGLGKAVESAIEEITKQSGDETAQVVLALISPLTGNK